MISLFKDKLVQHPPAMAYKVYTLRINLSIIKLNGDQKNRLPHNLNITIPGVENKALIHILKDKLSFSTGSACTTTKVKPSHVIIALGYDEERAYSSIRFGLGRFTTKEEIDITIDVITKAIIKLRNM